MALDLKLYGPLVSVSKLAAWQVLRNFWWHLWWRWWSCNQINCFCTCAGFPRNCCTGFPRNCCTCTWFPRKCNPSRKHWPSTRRLWQDKAVWPAWSYCWRRCNRFRCSWWCWSWRLKISRRRMIWLRWPAPRRYRPRINWILSSLLQFLVLWLWRMNTFSVLALKITVSAQNDWFTPKRKSVRKFTSALDILHLPLTSQVISLPKQ